MELNHVSLSSKKSEVLPAQQRPCDPKKLLLPLRSWTKANGSLVEIQAMIVVAEMLGS